MHAIRVFSSDGSDTPDRDAKLPALLPVPIDDFGPRGEPHLAPRCDVREGSGEAPHPEAD